MFEVFSSESKLKKDFLVQKIWFFFLPFREKNGMDDSLNKNAYHTCLSFLMIDLLV